MDNFKDLSAYVPGPDYEELKLSEGPQVTLGFDEQQNENTPNNDYDTYFNENELPPTSSGLGDNYQDNYSLRDGPTGPHGPHGPHGDLDGPPPGEGPPLAPPPPPPINYRALPSDHPLKWNDDNFYFDHDFKPLSNIIIKKLYLQFLEIRGWCLNSPIMNV